ncbi:MAG: arginine--tRNA ligase [Nanoarchaeota archaeon]|mgnify:CR=1 FL=1
MKHLIADLLAKPTGLKKEELLNLIEIPPSPDLGDYAFPCFILASKLKKNPAEIAKDLAGKIKKTKEIEKIEAKGSYLNFFINKKILAEQIIKINESYGRGREKEKILLEHASINPNASPHVGRARNSIIGDSIKRLLEFSGNKVETHYYVNDVSKQVAILALNFKEGDKFEDLLKKYIEISRKMKKNKKLEAKAFELLHKFEHRDKKTEALFKKIVDTAVIGQKKIFLSLGINFDYFDYESRYLDSSREILKELEKTGRLFKDREGRLVLNQGGTCLETRMKSSVLVLTRSDGTGLYPLRDLAYTIEKCKRGRNIIVLGEDQKLYFEQLKQALILMKKSYPEVVHYSFVLIKDEEKTKKMSTRSGELVLLEEFISEAVKKAEEEIKKRQTKGDAEKIGTAAIKYAMLRNENNKNIIFDWEQALNFEGDSGPYLQYSYARASSILRKIKKGKKANQGKIKITSLKESEIKLVKAISEFPKIVEDASKNLNPSLIASYSFKLAQTFSEFYQNCRVIGSREENFRLALVQAFRIVIKSALNLLGIEIMEEM